VLTAWRIVKAAFAADAFSGEGAVRIAGRWHSAGTRLVYTSDSASLATLEILVHMRSRKAVPDYRLIPCYFPEACVEEVDLSLLPPDWNAAIAPVALRRFGDEWSRKRVSPVLKVPSAVTQSEFNYLLNPEHEDFRSVDIGEPRPFHLDVRLFT
jgi:RES domain-containing protein